VKRRNPTNSLRDAAALLILILLALTVRSDTAEDVGSLVPEAKAAPAEAAVVDDREAVTVPGPETATAAAGPEVRLFSLGQGHATLGDGKTRCRIERSDDKIEAHCTRVIVGSDAGEVAGIRLSTGCPPDPHDQT
jgi:hypothetical protein